MKSKTIFVFISGVILGAAIFAGGQSYLAQPDKPSSAAADALKRAEMAVVDAKKRSALLDIREKAIKDQEEQLAAAGNKAPGTGLAGILGGNVDKKTATAISQMTKVMMKRQSDMKMTALQSRLNLSDDQTKALQDLMDRQGQQTSALADKMLSGKMSQEEIQKSMEDSGGPIDMDKEMQNILSPEQYAQYGVYQNDQKRTAAETRANSELMEVQDTLQLSEDQKNKVFTIVYQQYAQQLGVDGAKPTIRAGNPEQLAEAKKAALQAVLTPEQFDSYSKMVDSQTQLQKQMLEAITGSSKPSDSETVTTSVSVGVPSP